MEEQILLDHGSGGEASHRLVKDILLHRLDNEILRTLDDSAVFHLSTQKLAMTTDSYVVDPIFFPGGDIGSLAVYGTVNDLAMQGANPLYLTLSLILEEGFPTRDLIALIDSVSRATKHANVTIVAGDTKVVPKGHADKIFINTSGIGIIPDGVEVSAHNAKPNDVVIINGHIADHGLAILTTREGLALKSPILSDAAPLNSLVSHILDAGRLIHVLRDPTRGGVATALNEIASQSHVGLLLFEKEIPISPSTLSVSELLGLDPLYVANEGKCLVIAPANQADKLLRTMRSHPLGKHAKVIGNVTSTNPGRVLLKTAIGGTRILSMLTGEQLPRIC